MSTQMLWDSGAATPLLPSPWGSLLLLPGPGVGPWAGVLPLGCPRTSTSLPLFLLRARVLLEGGFGVSPFSPQPCSGPEDSCVPGMSPACVNRAAGHLRWWLLARLPWAEATWAGGDAGGLAQAPAWTPTVLTAGSVRP